MQQMYFNHCKNAFVAIKSNAQDLKKKEPKKNPNETKTKKAIPDFKKETTPFRPSQKQGNTDRVLLEKDRQRIQKTDFFSSEVIN